MRKDRGVVENATIAYVLFVIVLAVGIVDGEPGRLDKHQDGLAEDVSGRKAEILVEATPSAVGSPEDPGQNFELVKSPHQDQQPASKGAGVDNTGESDINSPASTNPLLQEVSRSAQGSGSGAEQHKTAGVQTIEASGFQPPLETSRGGPDQAVPEAAHSSGKGPESPGKQLEEEEDDRHNFALAKDGAKIIAVNKEAKKASALLDNDADTFLKNECKADKWVIVELSQLAKMDTFIISQNELYSSRVKEFEMRGRQTHPRAEGTDYAKTLSSSSWQLLGRFNASNEKGSQSFKLERPTWIKYLQLRILSHHGTEAVCALNDVCVFGKSAAEDLEARLNSETAEEGGSIKAGSVPELLDATHDGAAQLSDLENASTPASADGKTDGSAARIVHAHRTEEPVTLDLADSDVIKEPAAFEGRKIPLPFLNVSKPSQGAIEVIPEPHHEAAEPAEGGPAETERLPDATHPHPEGSHSDEQLPINSAGSAASRHGGSVYDMIVQELKAIKLAQKDNARTLADLQKNVTGVMGGFAFELDLLASRIRHADPQRPALMPAENAAEGFCNSTDAGGNGSHELTGSGLDFRDGECIEGGQPSVKIVKPPTELELLQLEVAALRGIVEESKRQADGMLLALAFSLLGGLGISLVVGSAGAARGFLKGVMLLLVSIPVGLMSCFWLLAQV